MSVMQTVLQSPHFSVIDQVCRPPRVDCGDAPGDEPTRFIFTRRGSFAVHVGRRTCFARPGTAVLVRKNIEYHITHPDCGGYDCCTDVWVDDAVLDTLGLTGVPDCCEIPHSLALQKTHVEMLLAITRGDVGAGTSDEVLLHVLGRLLQTPAAARSRSAQVAQRVTRVKEAIIGDPGENLGIDHLAKVAECSPFHLCRIFRDCTGQSIRRYRLQQRLGTALGRLGEGEIDLAALACDVGFSSHSHMTEAFRQAFGRSPSELREDLTHSELRRLLARLREESLAQPSARRR